MHVYRYHTDPVGDMSVSNVEIIVGIFAAVVLAFMLYFFRTVTKMHKSGLIRKMMNDVAAEEVANFEILPQRIANELTQVKGVGPKSARRLQRYDISTIKKLAASKPEKVADALGISEEAASRIVENARSLRKKTKKT